MSYLVQMAGLTVHNFLFRRHGHCASGRAHSRFRAAPVEHGRQFLRWILTRCTLYVLLPVSVVVGLFFVWQGMPQNLHALYRGHQRSKAAKQVIAQGPVASQVAIKMLGTNGGGFFNANSAHPFENPNAAGELHSSCVLDLLRSAACAHVCAFGRMAGDPAAGLGDTYGRDRGFS